MQTVYRYWALLVFLAVVVQVAFAGFGAFGVANDVADGKSKQRVLRTLGLLGLVIVQVLLAWFGEEIPVIGALHPVNAFLIFGFSGWLAMTAWRGEPTLARPPGAV